MAKKEIDFDRFYTNPKTGEKIQSHYVDGSEIKLSPEQAKRIEDWKKLCISESIKQAESTPKSKSKPVEKRGRPKKEEPKEEKK